jgi:SAM-dependent methyltransferase
MSSQTEAHDLVRMAHAFQQTQLLLTADELGTFTALRDGPLTEERLRAKLGLHPRGTRDFLDTLVAHDLLRRTGEHYANNEVAMRRLDSTSPESYLGGVLNLSRQLYPLWSKLPESLRTGKPQIDLSDAFSPDSPDASGHLAAFHRAMADVTRMTAPAVKDALDWRQYRTFVDVGGSTGTLSAELIRAYPWLRASCFDLAATEPHFRDTVAELGLAGEIAFHVGDFFTDPLPEADVLVLGRVLHDWNVTQRRKLLAKAYQAVRPGGAVVVYDAMIDDDRRTRRDALLLSLNMLLYSAGGGEYTFRELSGWLRESGFIEPVAHPIPCGDGTVAVAFKEPRRTPPAEISRNTRGRA